MLTTPLPIVRRNLWAVIALAIAIGLSCLPQYVLMSHSMAASDVAETVGK